MLQYHGVGIDAVISQAFLDHSALEAIFQLALAVWCHIRTGRDFLLTHNER